MSNSTPHTINRRIDLAGEAGAALGALVRVNERLTVDERIHELVSLRASQLNGCAFCIDMHWAASRAAGVPELYLAQVSAWSESPFFDERERAALALTDAITRLSSTGVDDEVWAAAAAHFPTDELAHLVFAIAIANTWNRLNVTIQNLPASYRPDGATGTVAAAA